MKTAGWSTRRVAGQVDCSECAVRNFGSSGHEKVFCPRAENRVCGRPGKPTRREDRRIVRRQALMDPTVTRSTIRTDVGVAIVPQTISRHLAKQILYQAPFPCTPFNTGTSATASTVMPSQINVECHPDWQKGVFSDESGLFGDR
ncbi:HTH_Tnp_Tc3_2 domain-containing protein [Trichonephila clavipes]|nr:HTH_Tnp_Tc3_2 domain-containing protein [Trichonephila clavipes]